MCLWSDSAQVGYHNKLTCRVCAAACDLCSLVTTVQCMHAVHLPDFLQNMNLLQPSTAKVGCFIEESLLTQDQHMSEDMTSEAHRHMLCSMQKCHFCQPVVDGSTKQALLSRSSIRFANKHSALDSLCFDCSDYCADGIDSSDFHG